MSLDLLKFQRPCAKRGLLSMLEVFGLSPLLSSIMNSGPPNGSFTDDVFGLLLTDFFDHLHMLKIEERFGFAWFAFDGLAVEEPWSAG